MGGKPEGQTTARRNSLAMQQGLITPMEAYMKAIDKNRFKKFLPAEDAALGNASGGEATAS